MSPALMHFKWLKVEIIQQQGLFGSMRQQVTLTSTI